MRENRKVPDTGELRRVIFRGEAGKQTNLQGTIDTAYIQQRTRNVATRYLVSE